MEAEIHRMPTNLLDNCRRQGREPTGWLGKLMLRAMNLSHSSLTDWGLSHVAIEKHWTILDVGCGGGRTIGKLATRASTGEVCGIDCSEVSVAVSRTTNKRLVELGRVEIAQGCVSALPFPDDRFDLVTAVNTHYYWPDLVSDLRETLRVLRPGGKLLLVGEHYRCGKHDERVRKIADRYQIAFKSPSELRDALGEAGYSDVEVSVGYDRGWVCAQGSKCKPRQ
jgi:SAM-dependent methyltransferase